MTEPPTVVANGVRFAYLTSGPAEGPLVLLLHGFPDTAHTWDAVRPRLGELGYRAVAPFLRGYHPTEIPRIAAYDSDTLGRDVLALIAAFDGAPAVVVGHDWGASAGYSAASLDPDKLRLLVTVAIPHPASVKPTVRRLWAFRHFVLLSLPGAVSQVRRDDYAHIDELVHRWAPTWDVPAGETRRVKDAFARSGCLEAALGYYRALFRPAWGLGPAPSLRTRIRVPTVAFAGQHDIIEPEAFEEAARRFESHYSVVTMPGGHFVHREHPEPFIDALLAVLAERAPPEL